MAQQNINENEFVFTYEGIAAELDVSESTVKRWFRFKAQHPCSKWGMCPHSTVYMSKYMLKHLRRAITSKAGLERMRARETRVRRMAARKRVLNNPTP